MKKAKLFSFSLSFVLTFAMSYLVTFSCQLRLDDYPYPQNESRINNQKTENYQPTDVTSKPIQPEEHPFAPQSLGPSFSLTPTMNDQGQWQYRLSYLAKLNAQYIKIVWQKSSIEIDPSKAIELDFTCSGKNEYELNIFWRTDSNEPEKIQRFKVLCPLNFDLRQADHEQQLRNLIEQASESSPIVIGTLVLPAKKFSFKIRQQNLSIWIYQLRSTFSGQMPELSFELVKDAFPALESMLQDTHLRSEWERLEKEYPYFKQMLSELKQLYPNSFKVQEQSLNELIPNVYVYIHQQRGQVRLISQSLTAAPGLSGQQLAPQFFKNFISQAAAKGADGFPGVFKKEERIVSPSCIGGAGIENCESVRFFCVVTQPGTPGHPGEPGKIPGIPGLNGFPALPGPHIYVDSNQLVADSSIEVIFNETTPSKGGTGSSGQSGGPGGRGGAKTCAFTHRGELIADQKYPDGAQGPSAPAGASGAEGRPYTCSIASVFDGKTQYQVRRSSVLCSANKFRMQKAHYIEKASSLQSGFWIFPAENAGVKKYSYLEWRRGLWLKLDFFTDSFITEDTTTTQNELPRPRDSAVSTYREHTGTDIMGPKEVF